MKILLTGATGFLGSRVLEKLIDINEIESVTANGRNIKSSHFINHPKAKYVLGDLSDVKTTEKIVNENDLIIHAAALSSPWGTSVMFETANVLTQKNLIEAAKRNNISRFIFISTPSIYFDYKNKYNIKESDILPPKFVNQYAETKRRAEILLENSGIQYLIFRPRAMIGRGDTVIMPRLIRAFDEGRLKIIGNGQNIVDLTSVANITDVVLAGIFAKEEAWNKDYNISNGEPVKLWDAISQVLNMMGKDFNPKKVPFPVIKTLAHFLEIKSKLINMKEPSLTKYGVGVLAKSFTMDISKAKNLLGYEPKVSTTQALEEFVKWYRENEQN